MLNVDDVREALENAEEDQLLYSSEMARLTTICTHQISLSHERVAEVLTVSKIIRSRYAPASTGPVGDEQIKLEEALNTFRQTIPAAITYEGLEVKGKGLWAAMLLVALESVSISH